MKKQVVRTLTMLGLVSVAMVLMVGAAQGQSLGNRIRIDVPFDFNVGDNKLPAGEYTIGRAQPTSGDIVLQISNVDNLGDVFRLTNSAQSIEPKHVNTLVFHRYGDQYFLFQVWPKGATVGRELPKSRSEREVARQTQYAAVQVKIY